MPIPNQFRESVLIRLNSTDVRKNNHLQHSVLDQLKCAEQEERNRKHKVMAELDGILRDGNYRGCSKKNSQVGKLIKQISECKIRPFLVFDGDVSPRRKVTRRHSAPTGGSPGFDALQNILDRHLSPLLSQTDPLRRRCSRNAIGDMPRRVSDQFSVSDILDDSFFSPTALNKDGGSSSEDQESESSENVFDGCLETYYKDGNMFTTALNKDGGSSTEDQEPKSSENVVDGCLETYYKDGKICTWC